ncbi:MAG: hypothetical protein WCK28_20185, partial [Burkholderiales bacterium]
MTRSPLDPTALSWCLGEIRESLSRAETALEQQLEGGETDGGRLRAARAWVHQAQGALQIVDLEGVAVVMQEAEGLLDRAERGELPFDAELVRALTRGFASTVEYLEGVVAGSGDSPVALFPHYRELLERRGADRIEPADLFQVDLSIRPPRGEAGPPLTADQTAKLRGAFEAGLLRFLRNPRDAAALEAMHGSVARFRDANAGSAARGFWWLAAAFLDALRVQALPVDVYAKRLVGRVNRQVAQSLAADGPVADRLLRDLLFMLARTGSGSALADEARKRWRLSGTVPSDFETPRYGVVDARTLRAAREATAAAKTAWEKYVRGSAQDLPAFAQAAQQLDAAVSRLPWPGLQKLSSVLVGLRRALAAAGSGLAEVLSLELATALLFVEQALERGARAVAQHDRRATEMAARLDRLAARQELDGSPPPEWLAELSRAAQERLTTAAFVAEMQSNLRGCEKALDAYFRDPALQRESLGALEAPLRQVAGALRLLGHDDAADGADTVLRQVAVFAETEAPDTADCQRVAASLGAIGFFVESLRQADPGRGGFEFRRDDDAFVARLGTPERVRDAASRERTVAAAPVPGPATPAPDPAAPAPDLGVPALDLGVPALDLGVPSPRSAPLDSAPIEFGADAQTGTDPDLEPPMLAPLTIVLRTPAGPADEPPSAGAPPTQPDAIEFVSMGESDRPAAGGPAIESIEFTEAPLGLAGDNAADGLSLDGLSVDFGDAASFDVAEFDGTAPDGTALDAAAPGAPAFDPPSRDTASPGRDAAIDDDDAFPGVDLDFDLELPDPEAEADTDLDADADTDTDTVEIDAAPSLEALLDDRRAQLPRLHDALRAAPTDAGRRAALLDALRTIRDEAMLLDDGALRGAAADALGRLEG